MSTLENLSIGTRVMVYDAPDGKREATVIAINTPEDSPGKVLGVRMNDQHPVGHECDGLCEKGYGWWTLPQNVATID